MYKSLTIERFRGIERLAMPELRRLNLILGMNNAGKTSVLEALFLLGGATNPVFATTLGQLRGQRISGTTVDSIWRPLFHELNPRRAIQISAPWNGEGPARTLQVEAVAGNGSSESLESLESGGGGVAAVTEEFEIGSLRLKYIDGRKREFETEAKFDAESERVLSRHVEREDFVRSTFVSARSYSSLERNARQFSHLLRIKQEQEVVDALRVVSPELQRIHVLSDAGGSSVHVDLGLPTLVPLSACGEGFVRLFSIVVEVTASRGGVLLIDEIDNGLHYSVMLQLWKLLRVMIERHDVQVFATTHNDEMIRLALEAFGPDYASLGLHRIDRRGDQHQCVSYDDESLSAVREQGFETRGG